MNLGQEQRFLSQTLAQNEKLSNFVIKLHKWSSDLVLRRGWLTFGNCIIRESNSKLGQRNFETFGRTLFMGL